MGWLLITYARPQLEAWESSLVLVLQPAGTVLWGYLIFQETFSKTQWLGIFLVIVGVSTVAISRALTPG